MPAFSGTQNVSSLQKDEAWRVNVRIQGCDLNMVIYVEPWKPLMFPWQTHRQLTPPYFDILVVTFWEGEIVDTKNYTFFTGKWEATDGSINGFYTILTA
ncbi:hypothetical protein Prudu_017740, partial [Prunus dulcis]